MKLITDLMTFDLISVDMTTLPVSVRRSFESDVNQLVRVQTSDGLTSTVSSVSAAAACVHTPELTLAANASC